MSSNNIISSILYIHEEEELEEEVQEELKTPDPPQERIVELVGKGKLVAGLRPKCKPQQ